MMKTKMNIIGTALLLGLVLTGCGDLGSVVKPVIHHETKLSKAWNKCLPETNALDAQPANGSLELADKTHSLVAYGLEGDVAFKALACVLTGVGVSEALISRMDATNALMGDQTASEGGLTYQWSYHPDNGLSMTVTED